MTVIMQNIKYMDKTWKDMLQITNNGCVFVSGLWISFTLLFWILQIFFNDLIFYAHGEKSKWTNHLIVNQKHLVIFCYKTTGVSTWKSCVETLKDPREKPTEAGDGNILNPLACVIIIIIADLSS